MLVPTSPVILVSEDLKDDSINTIKIDFSRMSFIKSTNDNFTQCPQCKALLTIDVHFLLIEGQKVYSDGNFVWTCRFCQKQNKNESIYFVSSNFKHCISKNASAKIIPPIILFLIDISGSMTSSIYTDLWTKSQKQNEKNTSIITNQMKKIIEDSVMRKNQLQYLAELQTSFGNKNEMNSNEKIQHFSKLSFLFSIIQYHLKILKTKKQKSEFRVGFIFFSDSLVVLKCAKQKFIPMYVDHQDFEDEIYPFKKQKLDFHNYQELFEKGKSYDRFFGDSRFSNFDVSKLSVQYIKTGGKTALGPALAFASGIISEHDQGSRIVVVTDSLPNYGILSTKETSKFYDSISEVLKSSKATMGIFRLIPNQYDTNITDSDFQNFIKKNSQMVRVIQISIFPTITEQVLENAIKSLRNLITHESVGHSYNLTILNDNKRITLNKFKYDNIDYRTLRFITSQSKNWLQINIDKNNLVQEDILFPTMTQLVIEYDDIWTKEKCLFMSYIRQNFVRRSSKKSIPIFNESQMSNSQSEQTVEILEQLNMENIQTIIDMRCLKMFEQSRQSEGFKKKTFRSELKNQIFTINNVEVTSIECQSVNDYTLLKNNIIDRSNQQGKSKEGISEDLESEDDYEFL